MKKIAVLVPDLELGGGQRVAINTAKLLAVDNTVHVVIFSDENSLFETDLKTISLDCPKQHSFVGKLFNIYKRARNFKKLIKKEQYDVILSNLESANLCAFLSDRKKSILTIHANPMITTAFDQLVLRKVLKYSKHIISVSDGLKDILQEEYGLKHVSVIKNAIDSQQIQAMANKEKFEHPRKFIVSAGRLVNEKRYDVMIDAFYKSKASEVLDLIIIGEGHNREMLEKKIRPDRDNVHLVGQKDNPFPIVKAAEFFLMSSSTEAFPMVLLEALTLNKPIVAYNCPTGVKEIINHKKNGILVENNNFNALVDAIDKMVDDKLLYETLSCNSLDSVLPFTPKAIHDKWMKYFKTVS